MKISAEEVERVAVLARLRLTEAEKLQLTRQLDNILEYMEKLNQLGMTAYIDVLNAVDELSSVQTNIATEEMNIPERQINVLWNLGTLTIKRLEETVQ